MDTKLFTVRNMTKIAILTAISAIIMLFEFPLPFAPSFYELDLSEAVILMGGFAMGPLAAAIMELLKNLLNLLLNGTITAGVGELANFAMGCALVVPASLIYKNKKSFQGAVIGLLVGILSLVAVGCVLNYFVMIPAYVALAHFPLEAILQMGADANSRVNSLATLVIFAVAPFNLVKGVLCSLINLLLYKRLSKILHI
ncbi:MAG: ECF transporter S component [Ruminococcaceae bacterium]|nr:ECF transporter S component [Oscillospiraceae bacterium]